MIYHLLTSLLSGSWSFYPSILWHLFLQYVAEDLSPLTAILVLVSHPACQSCWHCSLEATLLVYASFLWRVLYPKPPCWFLPLDGAFKENQTTEVEIPAKANMSSQQRHDQQQCVTKYSKLLIFSNKQYWGMERSKQTSAASGQADVLLRT